MYLSEKAKFENGVKVVQVLLYLVYTFIVKNAMKCKILNKIGKQIDIIKHVFA